MPISIVSVADKRPVAIALNVFVPNVKLVEEPEFLVAVAPSI